jgi:hypothetical protein
MLSKLGLETKVDLPGVGENYAGTVCQPYQKMTSANERPDHNGLFPPYYASEEAETLDGIFRGDVEEDTSKLYFSSRSDRSKVAIEWQVMWNKNGKGLIANKCVLNITFTCQYANVGRIAG